MAINCARQCSGNDDDDRLYDKKMKTRGTFAAVVMLRLTYLLHLLYRHVVVYTCQLAKVTMYGIGKLSNLVIPTEVTTVPEMPDCRGLPIIGFIESIISSGQGKLLHEYIDKKHQNYGPIFRGKIGPVISIFVSSPKAIREVFRIEGPMPHHFLPEAWLLYNKMRNVKRGLLFMDDEEWLHYREILNKIMLAKDSTTFMREPCRKAAVDLAQKWKSYANTNQNVPDLEIQFYQWSIEALLATLVGKPWSIYRQSILSELEVLSRTLGRIFELSVDLSRFPASFAKFFNLQSWQDFVNTGDYALDAVGRLVEDMEKLEDADDGLLQRMVAAGLEGEDLKRIVVDLILAAGDTTAYSMQWLFFLMASHPEVQDKIYKNVQGLSDAEIISEPLLKGAIKESLRLYPTAPFLTRILPKDTLIGGYSAHKGELVCISLYSSGRDEANFPRANEFWPERWLRNDKGQYEAVNNLSATLPFAMGARSCVGKKLAETQMSLTMAEIIKHFKINCLNKDKVTMKLRMISAPSEPLQIQLTSRD